MKTTAQLLERALEMHPAAYWHEKLALSKNALHAAKNRGSLSPALAGAIAEEMGESVKDWIVIAALESERESACKTRMLKRFLVGTAFAVGAGSVAAAQTKVEQQSEPLCIMLSRRIRIKNYSYIRRTRLSQAGFFCL